MSLSLPVLKLLHLAAPSPLNSAAVGAPNGADCQYIFVHIKALLLPSSYFTAGIIPLMNRLKRPADLLGVTNKLIGDALLL